MITMTETETTTFYSEIIEYFEEEGICKAEDYRGESELYSIITATIALEDGLFGYEHYDPFKAYALASYRSHFYTIEPTGEIITR
jgi:hypothetical protein